MDSDTWGDETPTLYRLAEHLARSIPVVAVLVNGGEHSKQEIRQAVRRGWPTVVLQGSGRLADELARLVHQPSPVPVDPALAEIVTDGLLDVFPLHGSQSFLHVLGILLAATITVLVAASTRFKSGIRWIRLRAHAEALKRELYRYRCRMGPETGARTGRSTRERLLASRMKSISRQLMQTEANLSALRAYRGRLPPGNEAARGDDGFSALTPSGYIRYRLDNQLDYYRRQIDALDRRSSQLQWTLIIAGALGTVLMAVGWGLWVPLTTTLVMVLTAWLGYQQTGNRLMKYQQAATDLDNIKAWWSALSLEDMGKPRYFEALIDSTEVVLQGELTGWVQEMKDVLIRLSPRSDKPGEEQVKEAKEVH